METLSTETTWGPKAKDTLVPLVVKIKNNVIGKICYHFNHLMAFYIQRGHILLVDLGPRAKDTPASIEAKI